MQLTTQMAHAASCVKHRINDIEIYNSGTDNHQKVVHVCDKSTKFDTDNSLQHATKTFGIEPSVVPHSTLVRPQIPKLCITKAVLRLKRAQILA